LSEPHEFRLKLMKSHIKYQLKSLERYRDWFPRADVVFELRGENKVYNTYVDKTNRLKLSEILQTHPDIKPGDTLVFTPLSGGRDWQVIAETSSATTQTKLVSEKKTRSRKKPTSLDHSRLQEIIVDLSEHFGMYAQAEFRFEHFIYDVIWLRVPSGNPVKVFEVQVGGNLDSALTKLKHARNSWNADLFLVTNRTKDADKAAYLLGGSFHEISEKNNNSHGIGSI